MTANRSPSPTEGASVQSFDIIEKADSSSLSIEAIDAPSKELLNDSVIDSVATDSIQIQSDQIDDCTVDDDTEKVVQLKASTTEFEIHAESKDILSTLSQQIDVLGPLNDISGQCLNMAALTIDRNQIIQNQNDKNSTSGGVLDLPNNEFIDANVDVGAKNILNICLGDENARALKLGPNTEEKPKIEVLSESSSLNLLETTGLETGFEAVNDVSLNENNCTDNVETSLEPSTIPKFEEGDLTVGISDMQTVEAECVEKLEGKSQSIPNLPSTIKFYCESLDDLKKIDSDSDVDIEEI